MLNIFRRAKPTNTVAPCMVALNTPELPAPEALQAYLLGHCASLPGPVEVKAADQDDFRAVSVNLGGTQGIVALVPAPIPWSDLEGPCATAWWWPEATEHMKAHRAHAIITMMGVGDDLIEKHLLLSKLAASVVATSDCAGIYWGGGTVVHPPQMFIDQAREATRDSLPLNLWIDFRIQRMDGGTCRLLTTGMEEFGKMELEIAPASMRPSEMLELGYGIAAYVLTSGADIRDGHTIGRSETEKIRIRFARSMWDRPGRVMRLEM